MKGTTYKSEPGISAFSARIRGRVQGVGFRYTCRNEARRLGLVGWVQNTWDGDVEVWSEGPQEKQEIFLKWLSHGPSRAQVTAVQYNPQMPTGKYQDFSIK
jgi:acylphosphatase